MMYYGMPCGRQTQGQGQGQASPGAMPYPTQGVLPYYPGQLPSTQQPLFPPSPSIGTTLPTGMPTGPMPVPMPIPTGEEVSGQAPSTVSDISYTPGYLRTQIGRRMRVEFLMGTGTLIDRIGTLIGVGASYILLRPIDTDDILMCDIYSIRFVTILL
jgi:hypothetical protein